MTGPRVSAVVPVRDGEPYIGEAIDSILGQTRPPDQVIVVDDGSEDGTAAAVGRFGEAVELIRRDPEGIGAAVNAGLEAADGELIAFLDADDLWTERKLELQCGALEREPGLELVFGQVEQFISPDLSDEERARLRPPDEGERPAKMKGTTLVRRSAVDRVGPFATDLKLTDFIDWYARATELGVAERTIPEVVLRRRLHRANAGRRHRDARIEYAQVVGAALRRRRT